MQKLEAPKTANQLSPREKMIYTFIENHPSCKSSEIATRLNLALPTVKKTLGEMVNAKIISRQGVGAGTIYTTEKISSVKKDQMIKLTDKQPKAEFILENKYSFIEIKRIVLQPKFQWSDPNEWSKKLIEDDLRLKITCIAGDKKVSLPIVHLSTLVSPNNYQPILQVKRFLPQDAFDDETTNFPIQIELELSGEGKQMMFDVLIVYDEA